MNHHKSSIDCSDCTTAPFTRNHYFTGKLLVERDFTDEQRYYMEKLRLHHQRLHGHGVVCGLAVHAHGNAACQDHLVVIDEGSAIDCCGHDIFVLNQEIFDFTATQEYQEKIKEGDNTAHVLQICLRYRDCPTEEIPVLFDDCGCDDTQCAPNRILESHSFDLIVDPEEVGPILYSPMIEWHCTTGPAHARRVALHEASGRLYVIAAQQKLVYAVDADTLAVVGAQTLPGNTLEIAVSQDGTRLYVVTVAASGSDGDPRQLSVLDTANNLGNPLIGTIDIDGSANSDLYLALAGDKRLITLIGASGTALVWPTSLDTGGGTPVPDSVSLGANLKGLTVDSSGKRAYSTDAANNNLPLLDLSAAPPAAGTPLAPAGVAAPSQLALVAGTAADKLAVISQSNQAIYLVAPATATLEVSAPLAHAPYAVAVSPGGHWAYVLEDDGTDNYLQIVDLFNLAKSPTSALGGAVKIGKKSDQVVVTADRIYIPFEDDLALPAGGGIAVYEAHEELCEDILWRAAERCPSCGGSDCIVLATITNYHRNDRVLDLPADDDDANTHIARIDNQAGRHLLPSVETLTELVKCILDHGTGGGGEQGPPGQDGLGIDDVVATFLPCDNGNPADGSADLQIIGGQRVLVLEIPQGCDGAGLNPDLPKILDIEWGHNSNIDVREFTQRLIYDVDPEELINKWRDQKIAPLLTIYFNGEMQGLNRQTMRVSIEYPYLIEDKNFTGLYNIHKLDIYGHVIGVPNPPTPTPHTNENSPWAVCFIPFNHLFTAQAPPEIGNLWAGFQSDLKLDLPSINILLKGDFVWAGKEGDQFDEKLALDADNIGGQVGINRVRGGIITGGKNPSGDLAQGGNFESWFFLTPRDGGGQGFIFGRACGGNIPREGVVGRVAPMDANTASESELLSLRGVTEAVTKRIMAARQSQPFSSIEDLIARAKIPASVWKSISDFVGVNTPKE